MRGLLTILMVCAGAAVSGAEGPYFATGIRIGEVREDSAVVWTRLTHEAERVDFGAPLPVVRYRDASGEIVDEKQRRDPKLRPVVEYPGGGTTETPEGLAQLEGAAAGTAGEVRLRYRVQGAKAWEETAWEAVDTARDYTQQFHLSGLSPGARYELEAEARASSGAPGARITGGFRTAPAADSAASVRCVVSTCQEYSDRDSAEGFRIYEEILKLDPDFFVMAGDILYYDKLAKTPGLARWHWQRMYSLPSNLGFHRQVSSYFMKDDHDTWQNDCWPGMESAYMGTFSFAQGLDLFVEQTPMSAPTYRHFRWGRDLEIWLVEGRDYRSPNPMKDGPEKTIWGAEQLDWFRRTVEASDATFRVLISPTPIVGPDRVSKNDNHANRGFAHEGRVLREFLAAQKNMVVVCGDRHWQYASHDPETGLREYSCGPASDEHAGGWKQEERLPNHDYLNVIGGFLSLEVRRDGEQPVLYARHHGEDGSVLNEQRLEPSNVLHQRGE